MTAAAKKVDGVSVSRREFLNYVWGSSMALFLAQGVGITFWFALPRLHEFTASFSVQELPTPNQAPIRSKVNNVLFFITHTDEGIAFLDDRCTHLGCHMPWSDPAKRFACPCHGAQFAHGGDYIAGPAPRYMDRYAFKIWDRDGHVLARSRDGATVSLPENAETVWVNTVHIIKGKRLPWQG